MSNTNNTWSSAKNTKIMTKKDKLTVENFVSTGMDLETLYVCFPDFAKEDIAAIYHSYKDDNMMTSATLKEPSINCS